MKKFIIRFIGIIFIGCILTQRAEVNAAEFLEDRELNVGENTIEKQNPNENVPGLYFVDSSIRNNCILKETPTSIVYDMYMYPATQVPTEKVVYDNPSNPYKATKSPAQFTKQGKYYFITDTFHNQVIYSESLNTPINKWKVMTSKVEGPHSVAADGKYYLVADTENHRVLVFEWQRGGFRLTQKFENMGVRPHYIEYDEVTDTFYVWSSQTCEMFIIAKEHTGKLCIKEIRKIKELTGHYIRSFTISGDHILFPSGTNQQILLADKYSLEIIGRFLVPGEISGMAYIKPIGNYFYMTVSSDENYDQSKATIIRTKDLNGLINGVYENMASLFPGIKIPYYIDEMHGGYYMTNHGVRESVFRFYIENDEIKNVTSIEY